MFEARAFSKLHFVHLRLKDECHNHDVSLTLLFAWARKLLLKAGANAARRCRRGRTPLDEAPPQSEVAAILCARWKELEVEATQKQERLLDELHRIGGGTATEGGEGGGQSKRARKKKVKKARKKGKGGLPGGEDPEGGALQGKDMGGELERVRELRTVGEAGLEGGLDWEGGVGIEEGLERGLAGGLVMVGETGLDSEQSGVTSLEATDGEEDLLDPVPIPIPTDTDLDAVALPGLPILERESTAEPPSQMGNDGRSAERRVLAEESQASGSSQERQSSVLVAFDPQPEASGNDTEPAGEPSADWAVGISSSSESDGGEWVTVKSHRALQRARKQAGQTEIAHIANPLLPTSPAKAIQDRTPRQEGAARWGEVNLRAARVDDRAAERRVSGSGEVAAFVSKIISKQAAMAQGGLEGADVGSEGFESERKRLRELAERLEREGVELEKRRAEVEQREKRLAEKEREVEGRAEPMHRSRENPWQLPRGKITSGVQTNTEDANHEVSTSQGEELLIRSFEVEGGGAGSALEQLRQGLEQKERELLGAKQEIERLQVLLAALKGGHQEEIRQHRVEAHAAAMAAAAASWRAWIGQSTSLQKASPDVVPLVGPERILPRSKAVGSERTRVGGPLTRTSSGGRPPPTLLRDQTAWAAALPPLPLLRSRQNSLSVGLESGPGNGTENGTESGTENGTEHGKPGWLREAAAAAAMAAAAVMREKAFAQYWGTERARALLQGEKVPITGIAVTPPLLAPGSAPPPESVSGAPSVSSSEWSSRPTTGEGSPTVLPELDQLSESSGSSSARSEASSFRGGQAGAAFSRPPLSTAPPLSAAPPLTSTQATTSPLGPYPRTIHTAFPPASLPPPSPGPPPSQVPVSMESQWVFNSSLGRMVPATSGPCAVSPEELLSQAPRLGLGATLARSRAYSSSNDLAGLSHRSKFGSAGQFGASKPTAFVEAPQGSSIPSRPASAFDQTIGSPLSGRFHELQQVATERSFDNAGRLAPESGFGRWGLGLRSSAGMTRSVSESHLDRGNLVVGGALLSFAQPPQGGEARGWFSLVPSPCESSEDSKVVSSRAPTLL
jgi:hypothetical protein